jgi:hypothetical protein
MAPKPQNRSADFFRSLDQEQVSHWASCFAAAKSAGIAQEAAGSCCDAELGCSACPYREALSAEKKGKKTERAAPAKIHVWGSESGTSGKA